MSHGVIRLGLAALTVIGLSAAVTPTASAADASEASNACRRGEFCLFSGPHQTGQILYRLNVKVTKAGFTFPEVDSLDPAIKPLSARNPIPDTFGCIVRLNDKAHFAGSEQEIDGFGDKELSGAPVGSMTPDCG
ncbi:hypothetical protein GCM10010211_61520 [Streptomyces albospinus]|uniref:Peptidase inhibitor family I36 n=1 Tax=Streptomyces albospinus TaxID=285515 RepID=A0ABQ2VJE0_9ACTN|nr:hypothetical protein [Streptomyces albospinus]GGU87064.1 hypothetical protein GCM10010211_61520 [Streptomyces albospinus]